MDANGVLAAVYDQANTRLAVTVVAAVSTARSNTHDANWVWSQVYDRATNTIRVIGV